MKTICLIALTVLCLCGCAGKKVTTQTSQATAAANPELAAELARMAETDQIAAYIPQGKYQELSPAQWQAFKDSVFTTHGKRLAEIFKQYGYPGFDVAGKEGAKNFWLMVQHADHDPAFQRQVLEKMKVQVDRGNAEPAIYGLLVDRVNVNTGKPQVYGTQVTYNTQICQAYPLALADSANVNERRKTIGLPPLEEYLNQMTQAHFQMNKESYLKQGIQEPRLYKTNQAGQ
jgi:hypothetical protein